MRILHLASSNRWTGAAAPALAEVESLRAAGVEAHYAYIGGYKLEDRLRGESWAHPLIEKKQHPIAIARTLAALHRLVAAHRFDVVHAHLTYDHWLARLLASNRGLRVVRTFHSRRTLRRDPITRWLVRGTDAVAVVSNAFVGHELFRDALFTPPPVDHRFFRETGRDQTRALHGVASTELLLGFIGKVAPGRGFEAAIATLAAARRERPHTRILIVGHGPHRASLEQLIASQNQNSAVIWAGYHESDLPEHFSAMDLLLFTAPGSDEGHRAVIEAMACATPAVAMPMEGIDGVIGEAARIAAAPSPESLASCILQLAGELEQDERKLRDSARAASERFSHARTAERLITLYQRTL